MITEEELESENLSKRVEIGDKILDSSIKSETDFTEAFDMPADGESQLGLFRKNRSSAQLTESNWETFQSSNRI